jgi:hypothetical protein
LVCIHDVSWFCSSEATVVASGAVLWLVGNASENASSFKIALVD